MKKSLIFLTGFLLILRLPILAVDFIDNGDSTVSDAETGLVWQQAEGGTRSWESSLAYCENLSLASQSDWRLPNFKELQSIVDDTKYDPAIDTTFFPNANSSYYWSSTTDAGNTSYAWFVNFYYGGVYSYNKSYSVYVRCVRGGQ